MENVIFIGTVRFMFLNQKTEIITVCKGQDSAFEKKIRKFLPFCYFFQPLPSPFTVTVYDHPSLDTNAFRRVAFNYRARNDENGISIDESER